MARAWDNRHGHWKKTMDISALCKGRGQELGTKGRACDKDNGMGKGIGQQHVVRIIIIIFIVL